MRIAVFSDIHGNDFAFDIVEADLRTRGVDQLVCLGDAIQGGPQPKAVVERLRRLNCPIVMGNADAWLLDGVETGHESIPPERLKKMEVIRQWSLSQLSEQDRAFINTFQPTITLPLDDDLSLLCFHGSPTSFNDVILPDSSQEVFEKYLGAHREYILTGGHTHAQQIRRMGDRFFFNPGSVGFAFAQFQADGRFQADAWAEYAILTIENRHTSLEFHRIAFDVDKLIHMYHESGRPFAEEAIAQYQA